MTKEEKNQAVRIKQAIAYLQRNDIDINSLTDIHYKNAIYIAAGVSVDDLSEIKRDGRN